MHRIIKFFTIFTILIAIFSFGFKSPTTVEASCTILATCDAAPGTCGSTCNGGGDCIINQGVVTRGCTDSVTQVCYNCTAEQIRDGDFGCSVYNVSYCVAAEGCPDYCPICDADDADCISSAPPDCQISVTGCVDTIWPECCTPGTPVGSCGDGSCSGTETCSSCVSDCGACTTQWCGDGTCNGGETCSTCATDCNTCEYCGDGACNAGETCSTCIADCDTCVTGPTCPNGTCDAGEWCGNCPQDCGGTCVSCGDGACNGTESCSSCSTDCGVCETCGDGICNASETCSSCALDCNSCVTEFCGDTICSAFESCSICERDCGACAENAAWFQVSGGHIGSANEGNASIAIQSDITDTADCVAPDCVRSLLSEDRQSTDLTDGFAVVGNGIIDANYLISERATSTFSLNTTKSRYQERYEYFYRNSGLGNNPTDDFVLQATDAQKPTYSANKIAYYRSGDLTIQNPWTVANGEKYVIFIDGNLTLTDGTGTNDHLIDVANGGFLAFIVSGDITVSPTLGNATLTSTISNLEGVYMADGTLTIQTKSASAGGDDRFIGEGVFVGWAGVSLQRDFSDGAARSTENNDKPVETFVYRPDFLVNMPDIMLVPIRLWQETN